VACPPNVTFGRMISRRYPHCITQFMSRRDLVDADYHLNGVGRAIAYTRIAAQELRNTKSTEKADYHVYAGVSAARTAIDSVASWLNLWFALNLPPSSMIDLGRKDFRKKLDPVVPPAMLANLDRLNAIGVDQMRRHLDRHYLASDLVVAVAGNVDHAQVRRQLEPALARAGPVGGEGRDAVGEQRVEVVLDLAGIRVAD